MLKYALVCGRIESYVDGTVKYEMGRDGVTQLVRWVNAFGVSCIGESSTFLMGSLEELEEIIRNERKVIQDKICSVLERFQGATPEQKKLMAILVEDGFEPDDITMGYVNKVLKGMRPYFMCNASFEDAYFDYMH